MYILLKSSKKNTFVRKYSNWIIVCSCFSQEFCINLIVFLYLMFGKSNIYFLQYIKKDSNLVNITRVIIV